MDKSIFEAAHIFHHYLEKSIPDEEYSQMTPEEALQLTKDVAALFDGEMSASDFGKKYRLPRRK